jgi:hypothetical protein
MVVLMPSKFPPQLPSYQYQLAPLPRKPPEEDIVAMFPGQIEGNVTDVAGVEIEFIITETDTQLVELQIFSALTKYVVFTYGF